MSENPFLSSADDNPYRSPSPLEEDPYKLPDPKRTPFIGAVAIGMIVGLPVTMFPAIFLESYVAPNQADSLLVVSMVIGMVVGALVGAAVGWARGLR